MLVLPYTRPILATAGALDAGYPLGEGRGRSPNPVLVCPEHHRLFTGSFVAAARCVWWQAMPLCSHTCRSTIADNRIAKGRLWASCVLTPP